ncbi:MAG: Thioredoxin 1 [Gammaproteobacteria bacterium]|nr:MAG: Thioredoxin 1 [Gammaproteobacteria bacterium]
MSLVLNVTDDSFETEVLKSDKPVLIDFWAEWCGPCKVLGPIIDDVAPEFEGKVRFTKINIDENPNTAPKYGIRGIPTIMIFKNGDLAATNVGVLTKSELTNFLNENI